MGNMELWDKVKTSDPKSLKEVAYGKRHFTTISAYYQIRDATKLWGPVGKGWGWDVMPAPPQHPDYFTVLIHLWVGDGISVDAKVPCFGCAKWDADGPKKALTDAITKGLSYLGFNSDVFLNQLKWDGNKYVDTAKPKDNVNWGKVDGKLEDFTKSSEIRVSFTAAMDHVSNKVALDSWAETVSAAVQEGSINEKDKDILNKLYKTKHKEYK